MVFKNRNEAGLLLVEKLEKYRGSDAIVLTIPRGGVPLAFVIAKELNLPLDIVLSKKIGHPSHKEYAVGAVSLKSRVLSDAASGIADEYIESETQKIRELLQKRYDYYYGNRTPLVLKDRVLIIVDDGIATGNTILSIMNTLHNEKPKKIIVAVPVAPQSTIVTFENTPFIDAVICLHAPTNFQAVGQFYQNFDPVDDTEVRELLNKAYTTLSK